jgi:hypothetical protein
MTHGHFNTVPMSRNGLCGSSAREEFIRRRRPLSDRSNKIAEWRKLDDISRNSCAHGWKYCARTDYLICFDQELGAFVGKIEQAQYFLVHKLPDEGKNAVRRR